MKGSRLNLRQVMFALEDEPKKKVFSSDHRPIDLNLNTERNHVYDIIEEAREFDLKASIEDTDDIGCGDPTCENCQGDEFERHNTSYKTIMSVMNHSLEISTDEDGHVDLEKSFEYLMDTSMGVLVNALSICVGTGGDPQELLREFNERVNAAVEDITEELAETREDQQKGLGRFKLN